jgi:hypothetical protein
MNFLVLPKKKRDDKLIWGTLEDALSRVATEFLTDILMRQTNVFIASLKISKT